MTPARPLAVAMRPSTEATRNERDRALRRWPCSGSAVIAVAILVYVVLDGFDLGVGILFGATSDAALRE